MGFNTTRFVPSHKLADWDAQEFAPRASPIKDEQGPPTSLIELGSGNPVEEIIQVKLPRGKTRKPALHQSLSQGEVKRFAVFDDLRKLHHAKVPVIKFAAFMGNKFNSTACQTVVPTQSMCKVGTERSAFLNQIRAFL